MMLDAAGVAPGCGGGHNCGGGSGADAERVVHGIDGRGGQHKEAEGVA
jgi:hypothetical protein